MKFILFFLLVVSTVWAATGKEIPEKYREPQGKERNVILRPGKWKEACFESHLGMIVKYSFHADVAIDFNIHWHEKDKVSYSVKHYKIKNLEGSFEPSIQQVYCLAWLSSNNDSVSLKFEYTNKNL